MQSARLYVYVCVFKTKACVSLQCVSDSTKISVEDMNTIEQGSEMEDAVKPLTYSTPLIFKHHSYTHIFVDSSQFKNDSQHMVLFLTLSE